MRRLVCGIIVAIILCSSISGTLAWDGYMVNSFYAISSSGEYQEIKEILGESSNHMYFQWGRLAPNEDGVIEFTNLYKKGISELDNRHLDFGVPGNSTSGYLNKVDYTKRFPENKAYLSIFFDSYYYDNYSKNSVVEFLNMTEEQWDELIIQPIRYMIYGIYSDTYKGNFSRQYTREFEFDGIVLDFEGFRNQIESENYSLEQRSELSAKYNKFLEMLNEKLGKKELIVCVHPDNVEGYYDGYDYEYISNIADYMILMAYDYYDADEYSSDEDWVKDSFNIYNERIYEKLHLPETQPYEKVKKAVDNMINKNNVDSSKLILGLDISGTKWVKLVEAIKENNEGNTENNVENKTYEYYILKRPYLQGIEDAVDAEGEYIEETRTYRKVVTGDKVLSKDKNLYERDNIIIDRVEYYYETPHSLREKYYSILEDYNIGGLSIWRLGTGSISAWECLYDIHNN